LCRGAVENDRVLDPAITTIRCAGEIEIAAEGVKPRVRRLRVADEAISPDETVLDLQPEQLVVIRVNAGDVLPARSPAVANEAAPEFDAPLIRVERDALDAVEAD